MTASAGPTGMRISPVVLALLTACTGGIDAGGVAQADGSTDTAVTVDDTATIDETATADDATAVDSGGSGPDSGSTPDTSATDGGCPELAPIDDSPLPPESTSSLTESTKKDGFNDDYVYNQAGNRKLGLRRDWGGSIVFFGQHTGSVGMNTTNTIDGADTGREVQIALYDRPDRQVQGCAYDASCKTSSTKCPETMVYMGWNPVQGGNRCNMGSGYSSVSLTSGEISLRTAMLQWNPNWDRTDCKESCSSPSTDKRVSDVELTQRVRFVRPNVVELSYSVRNLGSIDHPATVHEFPTVYAAFGKNGTPDLLRLFDSSAKEITSGWSTDIHGFRHQNFPSPGGWASLQNTAADYGVALFYESGMSQFQAWDKLANPTKFNNFRGLYSFPIRPKAVVNARSYLILGGIKDVVAETKWLDTHLPPFGSLDFPVAEAKVSGVVSLQGWALDNRSVSGVSATVDGGAPVILTYGADRPDVCGVWPGYPACSKSKVGFGGTIDVSALPPKACGHILEVKAVDGDGNEKVIARRRFRT